MTYHFNDEELGERPLSGAGVVCGVVRLVAGIREQFKVLRRVVLSVLVYVMHNLFRTQIPAKHFLHDQPMLQYIALRRCLWMCGRIYAVVIAGGYYLLRSARASATLAACIAGAFGVLRNKYFAAHLAGFLAALKGRVSFYRSDAKQRAVAAVLRDIRREHGPAVGAFFCQ